MPRSQMSEASDCMDICCISVCLYTPAYSYMYTISLLSKSKLVHSSRTPRSPVLQEDSLPSEPPGKPCEEGGVKHIYVTDTILSDTKPAQLQPTVL